MADDFKLIVPIFTGSLRMPGVQPGGYSVTDIREFQKRLIALDKDLRAEFIREVKAVGKPLEQQIKAAIPSVAPLSGMNGKGRLGWGSNEAANKTLIQFRTASSGKSNVTTLLRVRVSSPATVLADMAGRSGNFIGRGTMGSGVTRAYLRYNPKTGATDLIRSRKVSQEAGEKFIQNLNIRLRHNASRFIWPAAENSIDDVGNAVEAVLRKWFSKYQNGI